MQHVHMLYAKRGTSKEAIAAASRVRHHGTLVSLRTAAADGCELCIQILVQADLLLAELETVEKATFNRGYWPTFDMWLSQREDGGQGFCVISNTGDHGAGASIVPVAAFAYVADNGDFPNVLIRGRHVQQNLDVDVLQRFVKWNIEYEQDHQIGQDTSALPQYLVDAQSSNANGQVKIVELDTQARHRYAALSYASDTVVVHRWGKTRVQKNVELSVESLPKMFQDAILVTHALDIQYVWIDALCTPDDSWARDSEQAGSVYENAYLTLSATGAMNMSDGLLFQRPTNTSFRIPYVVDSEGLGSVSVAALPLLKEINRAAYIEMKEEPMFQDVWKFQDRVLSRRTLHFASDQMYYECLHHFASEDGLLQRMRYHTPVEKLPEGTEHFRRRCLDEDPRSRWCALVYDYAQYSSNCREDKLMALANVARAFRRLVDDEYIAGLWRKSLPDSLFWRSMKCKPSAGQDAPSWSWASVDGPVAIGLGYNRVSEFPARIVDVRTILADSSKPFGRAKDSEIEIEAPLVPLKLLEMPGSVDPGSMCVVAEDADDRGFFAEFDTIDRNYSHSAEAVRGMHIFALILMLTQAEGRPVGACGPLNSVCALIVTPVDVSGTKMKRVGTLSAAEPRLPYAKLGPRKTIVLV
ncbi:hypothetical protein NQ176_g1521 [Zarea fungicola]|uniref:Uncharacterized protein n=1 Tax=Zarea fungicola TaxID=93591 RepID=A0ACC1NV73_9HYPO|nr:hypothetical protein NQ176_g1521 [Lecanicillium fungicola]